VLFGHGLSILIANVATTHWLSGLVLSQLQVEGGPANLLPYLPSVVLNHHY